MKNNKLVSLILALLACFSLVVTVSAATDNQNLALAVEANPSTVVYGNTIKVSVMINENPGNLGTYIYVAWDTDVLTYAGKDFNGSAFADNTKVNDESGTEVTIEIGSTVLGLNMPSLAPKITGTGKVVDLIFQVKEGADADDKTKIWFQDANYIDFDSKPQYAACEDLDVLVLSSNHKHTEEKVAGKAPTCTETGLTDGTKCTVCGEIVTKQETIPVAPHTEGPVATCTTNQVCTVCNVELKPALDHEMVIDQGFAATCTTDGKTDGKHCSRCDDATVAQVVIPAPGHTEVTDAKVEAKCTETGLTEGKHCSVCNKVIVAQEVISAPGHSEVVIPGVEATYTSDGKTEGKKCTVCGTITVPQKVIPAKKHTPVVTPGKAPTCTETGLTDASKCSTCGKVFSEHEVIPALGHTEEKVAGKAPTCTATGLTDGTKCTVCGEIVVQQKEIAATGHAYDNKCDTTCNTCNAVREVPAHTYGEWEVTKEAEVEVEGEQKRVCSECGHEEVQKIAALERDYTFVWIIGGVAALAVVIVVILLLGKKKKQAAEA